MSSQIAPQLVFAERLDVLRRQLHEESLSVQNVAHYGTHYEPFADHLRREILKCLADVKTLVGIATADNLHNGNRQLTSLQRRAAALFGEALALKLADSIRRLAGDDMCVIGDKLLAEFGAAVTFQLPQLTTMADTDYYGTYSQAIRLRYPTNSIWGLPVLAHEFAHSFGPYWTVKASTAQHPRDKFVQTAGLGTPLVHDEYFCDLLATFLLGPAYVCTCIVDRFVPSFDRDTPTHPSDPKRAWWVLTGLNLLSELLDDTDDRADFKSISQELWTFWDSYSRSSGHDDLSAVEAHSLEVAIGILFDDLRKDLVLAPYTRPRIAWGLKADFSAQIASNCSTITVRDVLNAAWLIRLDYYKSGRVLDSSVQRWAVNLLKRIC